MQSRISYWRDHLSITVQFCNGGMHLYYCIGGMHLVIHRLLYGCISQYSTFVLEGCIFNELHYCIGGMHLALHRNLYLKRMHLSIQWNFVLEGCISQYIIQYNFVLHL